LFDLVTQSLELLIHGLSCFLFLVVMLNRDLLALGVRNIFTFEDLSDQGQKLIVLRTFGFVHKGENVLMMLGNDECPDRSSCDDLLVDEVDNRERAPFEVWQIVAKDLLNFFFFIGH
jgi:hypothetical protein